MTRRSGFGALLYGRRRILPLVYPRTRVFSHSLSMFGVMHICMYECNGFTFPCLHTRKDVDHNLITWQLFIQNTEMRLQPPILGLKKTTTRRVSQKGGRGFGLSPFLATHAETLNASLLAPPPLASFLFFILPQSFFLLPSAFVLPPQGPTSTLILIFRHIPPL